MIKSVTIGGCLSLRPVACQNHHTITVNPINPNQPYIKLSLGDLVLISMSGMPYSSNLWNYLSDTNIIEVSTYIFMLPTMPLERWLSMSHIQGTQPADMLLLWILMLAIHFHLICH